MLLKDSLERLKQQCAQSMEAKESAVKAMQVCMDMFMITTLCVLPMISKKFKKHACPMHLPCVFL